MPMPRCVRPFVALVLACVSPACGPATEDPPPDGAVDSDDDDEDDDNDNLPLPAGVFGLDAVAVIDSTSDLQPFLAATATTDVIGLGEAVHTSGGFYALKERLIRALVEEQGVRVFAIETPRTAAAALDVYVRGSDPACTEREAVRAAQGSVFGVFVDNHFISLLMSLCTFNQTHTDDPVRIYGIDAQQPADDIVALTTFLQAHAPSDAEALLAGLDPCLTSSGTLDYPADAYDACIAGLASLTAYTQDQADTWRRDDADAFATFLIDLQSFASWQDEVFFFETDAVRSYEVRDVAMAAIFLDLQARQFPDERVALWAHDYHLSMAHDEAFRSQPAGAITLGTVLHDELGPQYQAYAITAVEMAINWPGVGEGPVDRFVGLEDDVAPLFDTTDHEALLLDSTAALLQGDNSLGMTFVECNLLDNFNGVFVLRESAGMDAVFW